MLSPGLTNITTEIELEFTNRCNAACVACPRHDMPKYGVMTHATLDSILGLYQAVAEGPTDTSWVAHRVTVAGGGDPLIHPKAASFIERIADRGFAVHLITNAFAATERRVEQLVHSGLGSIAVSFWGIEPEEYERSMRLPYARTLRNVERLAQRAGEHNIPLIVTWVRTATLTSSTEAIAAFWAERGIAVDITDNQMWNRGGLLADGPKDPTTELLLPDPSREIWCADLAFSDTWTWDGSCVMCCCTYFTTTREVLGHVNRDSHTDLKRRKRELLARRPLPAMCQTCLQPRRTQSAWLAEPVRSRLSREEWNTLTYADMEA